MPTTSELQGSEVGAGGRHVDPRIRLRRLILAAVLILAIGAALGAWIAGTHIKSPSEAAADASAPSPSTLTGDVVTRSISRAITAQGEFALPSTTTIFVTAAVGSDRLVVSRIPVKPGDSVREGELVAEVSGRPVFLLEGAVPAYRALSPGARGADVSQLQEALARLGYGVRMSGTFDSATQGALRALYVSAGYTLVRDGPNGITIPVDEIAYVRRLPAVVVRGGTALGRLVTDKPILTIATGLPVVRVSLSPADAALVHAGQRAKVQVPGDTQQAGAVVVGPVPVAPGNNGQTLGTATLRLTSPTALGSAKNVTVTMTISLSKGTVLAVPVASVWTRADGSEAVTVLDPGGSRRTVGVTVGVSGQGYVEARPVAGASLHSGDHVIVG